MTKEIQPVHTLFDRTSRLQRYHPIAMTSPPYTPSFTERVLTLLQRSAEVAIDLLDDLHLSSGEFQRKYKRSLSGRGPRSFRNDWAEWYRQRRIYASMLSRMKKQGLIQKRARSGTGWEITKRGMERLKRIRKQRRNPTSLMTAHFTPGTRKEIVIVSFDISEREKAKRRWLREALKSLSFSFLQKSVWIGTKGVPKEFMDALRERSLLNYVHIVGVKKSGTLEKIS